MYARFKLAREQLRHEREEESAAFEVESEHLQVCDPENVDDNRLSLAARELTEVPEAIVEIPSLPVPQ